MSSPTREELLSRMDEGISQLDAVLDALTPRQAMDEHDAAGWNVRDHVAHLAVWADGIAAFLEGENRWETMSIDPPGDDQESAYDAANEGIRSHHVDLAFAEARDMLQRANARAVAAARAADDAVLQGPFDPMDPVTTGHSNTVAWHVLANTGDHYTEHLPWIEAIAFRD